MKDEGIATIEEELDQTEAFDNGPSPETSQIDEVISAIESDLDPENENSKVETENFANNMRLYETTGVGTMLLTDRKTNLGELFKVGKEIEDYGSKEELVEKINYYLKYDKKRKDIATAGQKRTLRDHTYKKRMTELIRILERYI
jgi:spore maturation protein CgeB